MKGGVDGEHGCQIRLPDIITRPRVAGRTIVRGDADNGDVHRGSKDGGEETEVIFHGERAREQEKVQSRVWNASFVPNFTDPELILEEQTRMQPGAQGNFRKMTPCSSLTDNHVFLKY